MKGVECCWELHGNLIMSSFSYVILMVNIKYVIRVGAEFHLIIQLDERDVVYCPNACFFNEKVYFFLI
jgi:hypothetical protein